MTVCATFLYTFQEILISLSTTNGNETKIYLKFKGKSSSTSVEICLEAKQATRKLQSHRIYDLTQYCRNEQESFEEDFVLIFLLRESKLNIL